MKKLGLQSQEEVKEERSKFFHWFAQIKPYAILTLIPLFFTLLLAARSVRFPTQTCRCLFTIWTAPMNLANWWITLWNILI